MDKKFIAKVHKGSVVEITLKNGDKYGGIVTDIDIDSSCVELSTNDGDEYITLSELRTFKVLNNNAKISNVQKPASNVVTSAAQQQSIAILSEQDSNNTVSEFKLENSYAVIRERFRTIANDKWLKDWSKIESSLKDAVKNHCFENDADRINRLHSLTISLFTKTDVSELLDLGKYLKTKLGEMEETKKSRGAPKSVESITLVPKNATTVVPVSRPAIDTEKNYCGIITHFLGSYGFINNSNLPSEYLAIDRHGKKSGIYFTKMDISDYSIVQMLNNMELNIKVNFVVSFDSQNRPVAHRIVLTEEANDLHKGSMVATQNQTKQQVSLNLDKFLKQKLKDADVKQRAAGYKPSPDINSATRAFKSIDGRTGLLDRGLYCAKIIYDTLKNGASPTSYSGVNFTNKEIEIRLEKYVEAFAADLSGRKNDDTAFFYASRSLYFSQLNTNEITHVSKILETYSYMTSLNIVKCHISYYIEEYQSNKGYNYPNLSSNIFSCRKFYNDILERITQNELLDGCIKELVRELRDTKFMQYLFTTDKYLMDQFISAFSVVQVVDFDSKIFFLRNVKNALSDIISQVNMNPTVIAYEVFLPHFKTILKVCEENLKLEYQKGIPEIDVVCGELIDTNGVDSYLTVYLKNKEGASTAENITISSAIIIDNSHTHVDLLRGGEKIERILNVNIEETTEIADIAVAVSYQYYTAETITSVATINKTFPVKTRDSIFIPVLNVFSGKDGQPMEDENLFTGRNEIINKIVTSLGTYDNLVKGHIMSIYGQTRSGKSSILFHAKREIVKYFKDKVLIANCGNIGIAMTCMSDVLYTMSNAILECLKSSNFIIDENILISLEQLSEDIVFNDVKAAINFKRFNDKVSEIEAISDRMVLIIADEFTYLHKMISNGQVDENFMQLWKALFQEYRYSALIASQENIFDFKKEFPNEFGAMELEKVSYLRKEDTIKLIQELSINGKPIFEYAASERLFELTNGSPFLTVKLCNMIAGYFNRKKLSRITLGFIERFLEDEVYSGNQELVEEDFEPQINDRARTELKEKNLLVLKAIASLSTANEFVSVEQIHVNGINNEEVLSIVMRLVERDVLEKSANRTYGIKILLLKEFLSRYDK